MNKIEHGGKTVAIVINNVLQIDNSVFNKMELSDRSTILTTAIALKPESITYVDNFIDFSRPKNIIAKLQAGEDVSANLAFHDLELPEGFAEAREAYFSLINPLIQSLEALSPSYPFAEIPDRPDFLEVSGQSVTNRRYRMGQKAAQRIWNTVAPYWAGLRNHPPVSIEVSADSYRRNVLFYSDRVEIGCQTIARYQVEQLAKQMNWEFPS